MICIAPPRIDFEALCANVEQRLCELGHLEPKEFPMTQREVVRGGKLCGIYFCLHGPRSVKLTAICDFTKHSVIYYGSDGIRRENAAISAREANRLRTELMAA
ncbi:hypothetical protein [Novipirellula artificiosorum]|uniref:Uncharacterized protein n=1 Tax=Novipirellula artificiosorum TaxID=2528016 RepID=A0A5C6DVK0_9BACT|nr:hypothetical protein [Novipirellula artificiosorum]TWU40730.1 hypothetical protein Poly41_15650 [Novipirellula artificiosorum]